MAISPRNIHSRALACRLTLLRSPLRDGPAQFDPTGLCRCQCRFGALRDCATLLFCDRRHDVQHKAVRLWHICRRDLDPAFQKVRNECNIPGETIQLGNEQHRPCTLCLCQRPRQFWSICPLTAFGLDKLCNDLAPAQNMRRDRRTLRFQPQTALALTFG